MPVDYPIYKVGDPVEFDLFENGRIVGTLSGTIQTVDAHGTYETCYADASYDIDASGLGWFKHIPELAIRRRDNR